MPYYARIRESDWPIVEIEIRTVDNILTGYISAKKKTNFETGKLEPALIYKNAQLSGHATPDMAREWAEWLKVAATTAESLDALIKTKEDLKRPLTVKVIAHKSIVVDFSDNGSE